MFLVQVHEQIKSVVIGSNSLLVAAINASLAGRGNEVACAGFRAVAGELRLFSMRLSGEMKSLQGVIAREVHSVAILQTMRRRMGLLSLSSAGGNACMAERVAGLLGRMDALVAGQEDARRKIVAQLRRTRTKCKQGQVAAQTARFEAAHAGAKVSAMTAAVSRIEYLVAALLDQTTRLGALLEEAQT